MIELEKLSPIGFGGYRVAFGNESHVKSLEYALQSGCNLIDTASNYTNGQSEKLIGKVLTDYDKPAFVITKAGYIQGDDLQISRAKQFGDLINVNENFSYCLGVDFLNHQLEKSLSRLNRRVVDGFLLHNPEYYLSDVEKALDKTKVYKLIKQAFSFLEEKVSEGKIRYYGISSNTLPFYHEATTTLNLEKLISLKDSVGTTSHFKLVQFPFNVNEMQAATSDHIEGSSLIDVAKRNGLSIFTNRPLNCQSKDGVLRLGLYDDELVDFDPAKADQSFNDFFEQIMTRLKEHGLDTEWREFPVLVILVDNFRKFGNPEAVDQIFSDNLHPFLCSLFDELPDSLMNLYSLVYTNAVLYSKQNMTIQAKRVQAEYIERKMIPENVDSFPYRICDYYLRNGIDHVLVGMRSQKYVKDFKKGFAST